MFASSGAPIWLQRWAAIPIEMVSKISSCHRIVLNAIYMFASSGAPLWLQRWAAISIEMVSKISSCHRIELNAIMH